MGPSAPSKSILTSFPRSWSFLKIAPVIVEMINHQGEVIQTEKYEKPEASVRICAKGFELFVRQAREARINSDFPKFGLGIFNRAMAAGYGEEAVGAGIKALRTG